MRAGVSADVLLFPAGQWALAGNCVVAPRRNPAARRRTARGNRPARRIRRSGGPNNNAPLRAAGDRAACDIARASASRMRSRAESSASSMLTVMIPSAWPVKTRGPPGGECRKSNAKPRSVSWSTRESTGRSSASSDETRRRLAASRRPHNTPFSGTERSGMVRFSRQAMQNRRGLPSRFRSSRSASCTPAGDSRFAQRRYFPSARALDRELPKCRARSLARVDTPAANAARSRAESCRPGKRYCGRRPACRSGRNRRGRPLPACVFSSARTYRTRDCMGMLIVRIGAVSEGSARCVLS